MIRRSARPDWQHLRETQRPWLRRLLRHGFVLGVLCLLTSLAIGHLVFETLDGGDAVTGSLTDRVRSGGSSGAAETRAKGAGSDDGGVNGGGSTGGGDIVEFTMEARGGAVRRSAGGANAAPAGGTAPRGMTIRIRFDPTPRLRMFLRQIDEFDREQTVAGLNKFIEKFGEPMEAEGRLTPVLEFTEMIDRGVPMLTAVMNVMSAYGPAGKETLDLVFDVKRGDYEESLNKYLYLKQQGVAKDYKIYRYQQKVWMVDEMRSEFNKSFTFE